MEIKHHKFNLASYITFENVYDDTELSYIWKEVEFLCDERKMLPPLQSGTAMDSQGNPLKQNNCIWIDNIYYNRETSNYINLYRKGFGSLSSDRENLEKVDINMKHFFHTNSDCTLMSYYENSDYYHAHMDKACYTYVFWLFKEPKKFRGGDLTFPELGQTINIRSNMAVLFPSWLDHQVDKIEMCDTIERFKCNGRFAFSTFFIVT